MNIRPAYTWALTLVTLSGFFFSYEQKLINFTRPSLENPGSQEPLSSMSAASAESSNTATQVESSDNHYIDKTRAPGEKIRILIVPGHESNYGGTNFGSIYERNLVVEIGQDLKKYLDSDNKYQAFITRDNKAWNQTFYDYFKNNTNSITAWEKTNQQKVSTLKILGNGSFQRLNHVKASAEAALNLYGITKWANENRIDLMIHIHLNDYPRERTNMAGKYSGLAIYVPAKQYANSSATKAVADSIFKRFSLYNPVSNLPQESLGVVDDPELIAVGANNNADSGSMLIDFELRNSSSR